MPTNFSYPTVKLDEIASVVFSWGYPITEEDLRPPKGLKPEVLQMVYACAIQKLTGLTIEELEESAERSLEVIDEWQVHNATCNIFECATEGINIIGTYCSKCTATCSSVSRVRSCFLFEAGLLSYQFGQHTSS